mgnify:CR=1 FL=1
MNLEQIKLTLEEIFERGYTRRVVFWYDPEGEFLEVIDELNLKNAKIWKLNGKNNFLTKYTLEVLDPNSNYLLYSPAPKPAEQENWLLDTQLYSYEFTADKVTLIMTDLGISDEHLRPVFKKYEKFFNNKERASRFAEFKIDEGDKEKKIDQAVLAVLAKQKSSALEDVLRAILMDSLEEEANTIWTQIVKFGDVETFWRLIEEEYGYTQERKLKSLFISLLVTSLSSVLEREIPAAWRGFITNKPTNCIVFIDHFMNHKRDAARFAQYADELEAELHLSGYLAEWELEEFYQADLFRAFDKAIISNLLNRLLHGGEEFEEYKEIISLRRTKHFYPEFENIYNAIYHAIELIEFKCKYRTEIPLETSADFFRQYAAEYHLVDLAYRKFCLYYTRENTDVLKPLSEEVEKLYTNWFLQQLSVKWSNAVAAERARFWPILEKDIDQQTNFYQNHLLPLLNKNEKVFVIISDALRYEAASELAAKINTTFKGTVNFSYLQGVVPSYTRLGMAALLPYKKLEFAAEKIMVDGIDSSSLESRMKILVDNQPEAWALKLDELFEMDRSQLREAFRGKKLVYLYHNMIDATGDEKATEARVFEAVEQTIADILKGIETLTKSLNATNIFVTTDHGFIYRRSPLEESDKTAVGSGAAPLSANRRFLIYDQETEIPGTLSIKLDYVFGKDSNLYAVVPRADNRFKLSGGGQNYVHGGASLQEIVIPLIKYKADRKSLKNSITKVDVRLVSSVNKITNSIFSLDFFQTEKLEDKKIPRTLKIYFVDSEGNKISNEGVIIADKTSDVPAERTFRLTFSLKNRKYDRTEQYFLVMEDPEEAVEKIYERIPFTIDLGIVVDFNF